MRRYTYAVIIIATVAIIVVGAVLVIYNIRRANTNEKAEVFDSVNENKIVTNNVVVERTSIETNFEEEKITPNTLIVYDKYYKECGHTVREKDNSTDTMVNLNKEELRGLYSDWEIKQFGSNEVVLYKEFAGECGQHYLLKENDGFVAIYRIESDGNFKLIEQTEISTQYLPSVDINRLKEGIKLNGKEELNAYIEDFE